MFLLVRILAGEQRAEDERERESQHGLDLETIGLPPSTSPQTQSRQEDKGMHLLEAVMLRGEEEKVLMEGWWRVRG
jgi:hypothetical protein